MGMHLIIEILMLIRITIVPCLAIFDEPRLGQFKFSLLVHQRKDMREILRCELTWAT